ncbi:relaxase/mobilization nuclease domain-containing protein [Kineococcus sp. SYSU DK003]|uniref:relaxase/mobilization nuclease domain-containing protein n=1 Tax=Kineococcus sp. SYSU DK003 TaxID=3383124 RepID=UPI003D7E3472
MIGKVTKGNGTSKLLWYLWGPGRANEHTDPQLVAAWDGTDPTTLEPTHEHGRHDVRTLARLLEQPLAAQVRLPTTTVWQCSLRLAPEDRQLTDAEWAEAARDVLHRTGFAPRDDPDGCRWIAMRHSDDHIHLVVTLARQDGRPVDTRNDYYKLGQACRNLENKHDLRRTAPRDRTGPRRPSRAEHEKAQRAGKEFTSRDELRREVRLAAAATDSPDEFFDRLRDRGVMVKLRHSQQNPDQVTGYAVAWPGDHTAGGRPVWFGGSKLAADLSWTRLQQEAWPTSDAATVATTSATRSSSRARPADLTAHHAAALQRVVRSLARPRTPDDLQRLERATLTLVLALAASSRRHQRLGTAALLTDRAAHSAHPAPGSAQSAHLTAITAATRWALRPRRDRGDLAALLRAAGELHRALEHQRRSAHGGIGTPSHQPSVNGRVVEELLATVDAEPSDSRGRLSAPAQHEVRERRRA